MIVWECPYTYACWGSRWALTGDDGHGCVGIGVLEAVSGSIGLSLIGGVN